MLLGVDTRVILATLKLSDNIGWAAVGRDPDEAIYETLANQSLRRPLEEAERALADALDVIFGRGEHDFAAVAGSLQSAGIRRPSGGTEPWTAQVLDDELRRINGSLDEAYTRRA
jgi:hypothetical protein